VEVAPHPQVAGLERGQASSDVEGDPPPALFAGRDQRVGLARGALDSRPPIDQDRVPFTLRTGEPDPSRPVDEVDDLRVVAIDQGVEGKRPHRLRAFLGGRRLHACILPASAVAKPRGD
jgi:hypothetical protein